MSSAAGDQAKVANAAATTDAGYASSALGSYNGDIGTYLSNVNSALSAGNPFQSKDYLTKQNLQTSGAMNSANDAEKQALGETVARTGTNSAAVANTVADSARQGQRDLTQYNAGRDTANEDTWLNQQDKLMGDQLAGANSQAGVYATSLGGQNSTLETAQQGADAQTAANDGMIDAGMTAAGTAAGGYFTGKCWIAAELYGGWDDPRTVLVRRWVRDDLPKTWLGRIADAAYGRWGEQYAVRIKTHRIERAIMQHVFDCALMAARKKYEKPAGGR
jgi:hypothetical protein